MENRITFDDIQAMERIRRINFVNTLSGFKSAALIGTLSHRGAPNVAMFNSVAHITASPPHLGFFVRPLTVPRHTYHNIKARGYFTINLVSETIVEAAHQTSADYPEGVSEFDACGLTPHYTDAHPAPYVQECPVKIGLQYAEEHHLRVNDAILIVGRIVEVLLPPDALAPTGHLELDALGAVAVAGLDSYYHAERRRRLPYARVKKP